MTDNFRRSEKLATLENDLLLAGDEIAATQTILDQRMVELGSLQTENARLQDSLAEAALTSSGEASSPAIVELKERIEGQSSGFPALRSQASLSDHVQSSRTPS